MLTRHRQLGRQIALGIITLLFPVFYYVITINDQSTQAKLSEEKKTSLKQLINQTFNFQRL